MTPLHEAPPRLLRIRECELASPEALHADLARALGFPAYYGSNLAALADCLGDVSDALAIAVERELPAYRRAWFDGFCRVFERAARENPAIDLQVIDVADGDGALPAVASAFSRSEDTVAYLQRIEHRLDALQAAVARLSPVLPPAPASAPARPASGTCRNKASGSDGDRFECGSCGCRVSDYLEDTRQLIDGLKFCPNCGCEVANPEGSNALGWVGELI